MRSYIRNVGTGNIYNEVDEFMAGQIIFCASTAIPAGYLECNGATISRTSYATLFAAIGSTYGAGDGATTFQIPDLRGEFVRGADRGRGVDSGRAVGSAQGDAIRNITGSFHVNENGVNRAVGVVAGAVGAFRPGGADGAVLQPSGTQISGKGIVDMDVSRVVPTAGENRPRSVALVPVIKYS